MSNIAAINAGSNAIRMVVGQVDDAREVKPLENIRLPVRLGEDVFGKGMLEEKAIRQADAMLANWAIEKRKQFFEQVFGVSLRIH